MIDKYLLGLRQKEYRERKAIDWANDLYRMNKKYMNQPEVSAETLALWDSQPAITFDLGSKKKD